MKWWLISDEDVNKIREILNKDFHAEIHHLLDTGLHQTNAVPADFQEEPPESSPQADEKRQ